MGTTRQPRSSRYSRFQRAHGCRVVLKVVGVLQVRDATEERFAALRRARGSRCVRCPQRRTWMSECQFLSLPKNVAAISKQSLVANSIRQQPRGQSQTPCSKTVAV